MFVPKRARSGSLSKGKIREGDLRIAVVGVGAAGLATALSLSESAPESLDLTLFDPGLGDPRRSGRGLAYQEDHREPLLNAPSSMMSVRAGDEADFSRWLRRTGRDPDGFVPRPVFGAYLADTFESLKRQWIPRNGTLHCVPFRVTSVARSVDRGLAVSTATARFEYFDAVFLCVGWDESGTTDGVTIPAYPLDDTVLRALGTSHVGIVGTGLTAVDVARALLSHGYGGRITLASRRGMLPGTRAAGQITPKVLTRDRLRTMSTLDLRTLLQQIQFEADAHGICLDTPRRILHGDLTPLQALQADSRTERSWRSLFVALCDEAMADAWNLLDHESRKAFRRWFHPYFQSWCNPMPPSTAKELTDAMISGQLSVKAGLRRVESKALSCRSGDVQAADLVISAHRNAARGFADTRSPLIQSLIDAGLARRDTFGGLRVRYGTWQLIGEGGAWSPIYAVGSLAQSARYYVNALDGILRTVPEAVSDAIRALGAAA
ncbi:MULTISPECIES: FAD/NAD(P)-binding protein [unclassified Microbacterium]|uniref:FAD/NAD(P)-binding protein n=1 Tax=unclassified Microbacterium TaxID=2609290 RepID=UPI000EAA4E28|nr:MULTISPECIES: FAD/NAD(P)-binding protein [unclassified Microbacterium]MBT2484003.1 FAD/NAD(P)-binding protein [Microbacterium sp. ISL-108]RKN66962.1 hypothetical protein D7252_04740 [Microbacterium sp. CGR2]